MKMIRSPRQKRASGEVGSRPRRDLWRALAALGVLLFAGGAVRAEESSQPAPAVGAGEAVSPAIDPSPPKKKSLIASLLQEGSTGSGTEGGGSEEERSGSVRWSGSGELLFWSRASGTFQNGIFADGGENAQFKTTHFHPKLSARLGSKGSAYIEGCLTHPRVGTQAEQAWLEYNPGEKLNVQAGRILIPFGLWNQIHDVYDHKSISYPLMYVGHEETEVELLGGPTPILSTGYSDIGVLLYGSVWLNDNDQIWYGGYACNGRFGSTDIEWLDLWNNQEDNNTNKALGGRLIYSHGDNLSAGVSYQSGRYDPDNSFRYRFGGFDLYYRFVNKVNLRAEYLRNPVDSPVRGYTKQGWYASLDAPISRREEVVFTIAGLRRSPAQRVENSVRYTFGYNRRLTSSLKVKTELEHLSIGNFVGDPTDADDARFGTSLKDITRFKASLVAIF